MPVIVLAIIIPVVCVAGLAALFLSPIPRPRLTESDLATPGFPWWKIYYLHKYVRLVKSPPDPVTPEFFASMPFEFSTDPLSDRRTITLNALGDLMPQPDLHGQHPWLWESIGERVFGADISMANLEFAVNPEWLIHKLYRYSITPEQARPLLGDSRFGKFHVVSLANNHLNDSLSRGIASTVDFLDKQGIMHVGANRSVEEQDDFPILNVHSARIAVLSYSFSTNGIELEPGFRHGVNVVKFNSLIDADYDPSLVLRHIAAAKSRGANYIVAALHWSVEFEYYPPLRIMDRGHAMLDAGIDCIIGHHPHIINPVEHYRTRDGRDGLIFYSLGNVTTYALAGLAKKIGEAACITLETGINAKGRRIVRPSRVSLLPFLYARSKEEGQRRHRLIPLKQGIQALQSGTPPRHFTKWHTRMVPRAWAEYRRYFSQRGIEII
jgi:poly-gamma-glutamate synthesis protein (capsule biosynthesis protein)